MTLTTEWLKERLKNPRTGTESELISEVLRYREAQPFMHAICNPDGSAWLDENCVAGTAEELKPVLNDLRRDAGDGFRIIPLYTAPPAPAAANLDDWGIDMSTGTPILVYKDCSVIESEQAGLVLSLIKNADKPAPAVPDEMTADQAYHLLMEKGGVMSPVDSAVFTWNACRAAMLAQPVSQGYKLVPVEPTEEMIAAAMNCDDVEFNSDETFCVNFDNIYRAMLAAAPEGACNALKPLNND